MASAWIIGDGDLIGNSLFVFGFRQDFNEVRLEVIWGLVRSRFLSNVSIF